MSNELKTTAGARTLGTVEYVNAGSLSELAVMVNDKKDCGWDLCGPLVVEIYYAGTSDEGTLYIQPMQKFAVVNEAELAAGVAALEAVDGIVKAFTAFPSMAAMLTAPGNYRPTIRTRPGSGSHIDKINAATLSMMAEIYDRAQIYRGDERRAYRD